MTPRADHRLRIAVPIVAGPLPKGTTARVLAQPGRTYALYLRGPAPAELSLNLLAGSYKAEWINTKSGATETSAVLHHPGGKATLKPPAYTEDAALRITAATEP